MAGAPPLNPYAIFGIDPSASPAVQTRTLHSARINAINVLLQPETRRRIGPWFDQAIPRNLFSLVEEAYEEVLKILEKAHGKGWDDVWRRFGSSSICYFWSPHENRFSTTLLEPPAGETIRKLHQGTVDTILPRIRQYAQQETFRYGVEQEALPAQRGRYHALKSSATRSNRPHAPSAPRLYRPSTKLYEPGTLRPTTYESFQGETPHSYRVTSDARSQRSGASQPPPRTFASFRGDRPETHQPPPGLLNAEQKVAGLSGPLFDEYHRNEVKGPAPQRSATFNDTVQRSQGSDIHRRSTEGQGNPPQRSVTLNDAIRGSRGTGLQRRLAIRQARRDTSRAREATTTKRPLPGYRFESHRKPEPSQPGPIGVPKRKPLPAREHSRPIPFNHLSGHQNAQSPPPPAALPETTPVGSRKRTRDEVETEVDLAPRRKTPRLARQLDSKYGRAASPISDHSAEADSAVSPVSHLDTSPNTSRSHYSVSPPELPDTSIVPDPRRYDDEIVRLGNGSRWIHIGSAKTRSGETVKLWATAEKDGDTHLLRLTEMQDDWYDSLTFRSHLVGVEGSNLLEYVKRALALPQSRFPID